MRVALTTSQPPETPFNDTGTSGQNSFATTDIFSREFLLRFNDKILKRLKNKFKSVCL
jgi:hypothetical protein